MSDEKKQEAIVIADESEGDQLDALSALLESKGAKVTSKLDFLGQIVVQCDASKIPELAKLKGVAKVERSGRVELPPPDSDVQ